MVEVVLRTTDEGPMLETLDYTIRIGRTPTILYFNLYPYSAYAARYVMTHYVSTSTWIKEQNEKLAKTLKNFHSPCCNLMAM